MRHSLVPTRVVEDRVDISSNRMRRSLSTTRTCAPHATETGNILNIEPLTQQGQQQKQDQAQTQHPTHASDACILFHAQGHVV
jgi:hypothetical protein